MSHTPFVFPLNEERLEAFIEMIWSCRARPVKSDVPPF